MVQRHLVPLVPQDEYDRFVEQRAKEVQPLVHEVQQLEAVQKKLVDEAKKRRDAIEKQSFPFEMAFSVTDAKTIENAHVQIKVSPEKLRVEIPRRFLRILGEQSVLGEQLGQQTVSRDEASSVVVRTPTSGRKQLDDWIASPARLDLAHQLALGRPITSTERAAAESYLVQAKERLAAANIPADQHDLLAWQSDTRATFRLNEFVYAE